MGIRYHKERQEFHLFNETMSYIICVLPNGHIGNLYTGKRVSENDDYSYLLEGRHRPLTTYPHEGEERLSLQHTRQDYACRGTGDMSLPAFTIRQEDGSCLSDFRYQSHRIIAGKPDLTSLPHTYVEDDSEADTLEIELWDEVSETRLRLSYTIYEEYPALTRHASFEQVGNARIVLERALSMNLDLPDMDYEWIHLDGAWGRERQIQVHPLHQGCQSIYSLKGASSAEHNPFIALKRPHTTEDMGEVMGFSLVYSGNFLGQIDVTPYHQTRLSMGIHPEGFEWVLEKGQVFDTPEVVMVYSDQGLNGMSQAYHNLYNHRLIRGVWREKERPVLLNNWEAMTFDFDENRILSLAKDAAEVGVELFVMDDGWFGERNHDRAGLGDWTVNRTKLPRGLEGVIEAVHRMGMKFGLWIEPEMVNKDSQLYRSHPDWILHHPKRQQSHGRHQYVLDLSCEDVYQNIYQQIHTLLSQHEIDYIKWDMNRYMTEVYSVYHQSDRQGEIYHRYMLNVYRLYEALTKEFPAILFESCSSGGGRFDPAMLYYAPQTWTSDDSDAIERLKIQHGTSFVYPLSSMGCHVSEVPNQQVGRITPLETRTHVAYFGNFGYELELAQLSQEENQQIKQDISFYKQHRRTFQYGRFSRLLSPFEEVRTAWQVVSENQTDVFVGLYQTLVQANEPCQRLRLKDLEEQAIYECKGCSYSGASLMNIGLVVHPDDFETGYKDFASVLYHLRKV